MTALLMIVAATEEEAVTGEEHAAEALDKGMTEFALMLSEVWKRIPSMSLFHLSGHPLLTLVLTLMGRMTTLNRRCQRRGPA
jgi:hypothetical protein